MLGHSSSDCKKSANVFGRYALNDYEVTWTRNGESSMANTISLPKELNDIVEPIGMSNGLTSVFIEVLAISGSILAKTNREKEMIIWLAQRDQSVVGIGTVGFDIDEMPWTIDSF